jgi:flagellar biosynthesis/type III secretory pathway chaperone|tara:strand:+ start:2916 stop:3407 length:492 start_codon:yes stop_codon:yes gene_type:complete
MSKFTDDVANKTEYFIDRLEIPEFSIENLHREIILLENLQTLTNRELEEQLSVFGGYKSYLEAQLGQVESRRGAIEASYNAGLDQEMFITEKAYLTKGLKKPNKESLKGESLVENKALNELRKGLIETEALATRIKGLRDAYVSQYATVSRVIALRATVPDQV